MTFWDFVDKRMDDIGGWVIMILFLVFLGFLAYLENSK